MKRHAIVIALALLLIGCAAPVHQLPTEQPSQSEAVGTNPVVYVEGEVKKAGRFNWYKGLTLTNAIEMAGGFTDFAHRNRLEIHHADGTRDLYSYLRIVRGFTNNPNLNPLDLVIVRNNGF